MIMPLCHPPPSETAIYLSVACELLLCEEAMLHHGAEDLVGDVGHSGVGGWFPDEAEEDGVTALCRQHAAVAGRVLGADVMDRPDCPQLDRLLLSRLQQREEGLERSAVGEIGNQWCKS